MQLYKCFATLALALGIASSASAVPLSFSATLTLRIGALPAVTATGAGTGDFAGAGGSASIPAGVFSIVTTLPIHPPLLVIDGFGAGAPGQGGTGQLPLTPGTNKALVFGGVTGSMQLDASAYLITGFTGATPNNAAAIPLTRIGRDCSIVFCPPPPVLGGLVMGTIKGNPYQLGMITVMGGLNGTPTTLIGTGFDNRTAGGAGVLQLVSPNTIALGALGSLAILAELSITVVPEPSTALLVGFGLAALAGLRPRSR
jgi:hypothetical protein